MTFSSIPFLIAAILSALYLFARRARTDGRISRRGLAVFGGYLLVIALWSLVSAYLAWSGAYVTQAALALMPGLWLNLVPLVLALPFLAGSAAFRHALIGIADYTPHHWVVYLQALRIFAVGTMIETARGTFPLYFELGLGITDLAFGLSALFVAPAVRAGRMSRRALGIWHLIGFAIIALPAGLLMQMGLPGPIFVFDTPPTAEALFAFPMALAPTVAVPLLILVNLWIGLRLLWRQGAVSARHV